MVISTFLRKNNANAVVDAEKATKGQGGKKGKTKGKTVAYVSESDCNIEENLHDESESDTGSCIIVDVR